MVKNFSFKKDLILLGVGRIIAAVVALVSIRVATTLLSPEQFGELALLNAVLTFCGLFLINPIAQYINLNTHLWWDEGSLYSRIKSYKSYILLVAFIGMAIVIIMYRNNPFKEVFYTAIAAFLMVFSYTWNGALIPMLNMLGFRSQSVWLTILTLIPGVIFSTLFTIFLPSATSWFLGQAAGMAIGAIGASFTFKSLFDDSLLKSQKKVLIGWSEVLSYCLPLALATLFMWLLLSGYRFAIEAYWGLVQLGLLAVGFQLTAGIWALVESLAMQLLYPAFYRLVSDVRQGEDLSLPYSDLLNTLLPIYFLVAGFMFMSAPYVLKLLVAPEYQNAINFFVLGVFIELCRVLGNLLSNAAHAKREVLALSLPYGVGAFVSLLAIYLFGYNDKTIDWALSGLLIGSLAMVVVMGIVMFKKIKFNFELKRLGASFLIMILLYISTVWSPIFPSAFYSLTMLIFIGLSGCFLVFIFLWRSPSFARLTNIHLRGNE